MKCTKTTSGSHIFHKISILVPQSRYSQKDIVVNKCIACGIIDNKEVKEPKVTE